MHRKQHGSILQEHHLLWCEQGITLWAQYVNSLVFNWQAFAITLLQHLPSGNTLINEFVRKILTRRVFFKEEKTLCFRGYLIIKSRKIIFHPRKLILFLGILSSLGQRRGLDSRQCFYSSNKAILKKSEYKFSWRIWTKCSLNNIILPFSTLLFLHLSPFC